MSQLGSKRTADSRRPGVGLPLALLLFAVVGAIALSSGAGANTEEPLNSTNLGVAFVNVSPSDGLATGQVVKVSGRGLNPSAAVQFFECSPAPYVTTNDCDMSIVQGAGTTDATGAFTDVDVRVAAIINTPSSGARSCSAALSCGLYAVTGPAGQTARSVGHHLTFPTTTSSTSSTTSTSTTSTSTTMVPTGPTARVNPSAVRAGQQTTVTGSGFGALQRLEISIGSPPAFLQATNADGSGNYRATVTIPSGIAAGSYQILVSAPGGTVQATTSVEVAAVATASPPTTSGSAPVSGPLPVTGSELLALGTLGGLTSALGWLLVRASATPGSSRRNRRRGTTQIPSPDSGEVLERSLTRGFPRGILPLLVLAVAITYELVVRLENRRR